MGHHGGVAGAGGARGGPEPLRAREQPLFFRASALVGQPPKIDSGYDVTLVHVFLHPMLAYIGMEGGDHDDGWLGIRHGMWNDANALYIFAQCFIRLRNQVEEVTSGNHWVGSRQAQS